MRYLVAASLTALCLPGLSSAQCGALTVTGTLNPAQIITLTVAGATPLGEAFLLAGSDVGSTFIDLGALGSLTVGLVSPFTLLPIGQTNASGNLSYSFSIPANVPTSSLPTSLTLQVVTVTFAFGPPILSFCVSNTETIEHDALGAGEALRHWHEITLEANALDHTPSLQGPLHMAGHNPGPCRTARAMAITYIAMFEALNAVQGGYQSYAGLAPATGQLSRSAAIAQAARDTLVSLYPSQAWIFDAALAVDLGLVVDGPRKTAGIALGQAAAAALLAMRAADGSNHAEPLVNIGFLCSNQPGFWRQDPIVPHPLALGAEWAQVAPFVLTSASQFQAPPPPALTSPAYTVAFDEVKAFGGDGVVSPHVRSQDQTWIGLYWGYDGSPGLGTPPRLFNQIVMKIARQRNTNVVQTARLLALVNASMADSGLACWESKYFYQFWRPCSGIRQSDPGTGPSGLGDGNPATVGDVAFTPLAAPASNSLNPNL
ncbi:MAG: vanadium-dependent haloperoxidase, partial [Planctomycetota bacterium]